MTMTYKDLVKPMTRSDLTVVHYHYAIQSTLEISRDIVDCGELDDFNTWDEEGFADYVADLNQEFEFDEDDLKQIEDIILNEYNEELTALNEFVVSKQKPKSWAYLVRFE